MNTINIKRFGLAFGLTGIILYAGCIFVMLTVGRNGTILFFNSLLHGLDTSSIIRMDIQVSEVIIGIIETFIISWLIGACIAMFYNISLKKKSK
ncbi:hypothetical protein MNBD_BACTEROID01-1926 [hydrothermal vent metagenome]|uniref:Uncharacterized protein n=1 Tax=hydrothermal vent metagenome TaxID=652676 RepID=A0A3B0U8M2_9ZZZZ